LSSGYSRNRDYKKALEFINQSLAIAQDIQNKDLEALGLEVRGEIYRQAGQRQAAIASYQEALSITNSFSALAGLSRLYQESNLLATAIVYYKQAINKNEEQNLRIIAGITCLVATIVSSSHPKRSWVSNYQHLSLFYPFITHPNTPIRSSASIRIAQRSRVKRIYRQPQNQQHPTRSAR
jgi:tetratricopeptide (TPR) repeat protein